MVALTTPQLEKGWKAVDFNLLSVDGGYYNLEEVRGENGLVVAFICNHCPYVKAIADKIVREADELRKLGVGFVAINSNDAIAYPDDSYDNMQIFARQHKFKFPYLFDATQEVAKKYDAVCTPDFFGFNSKLELQYRGRLDSAKKDVIPDAKRELFIAMSEVAKTEEFKGEQIPSIGCSIKWK
ncbi:thioredoxin family protein [Candidatus Bandiella euplotis]|uniref:Thiol-disulfide oxidoreductase family protein n=1 Tax=Candidatus Bandiella euplotis TaxID=1664265 RepID=A0ABZ0UMT2_9RICK|nr:thioredoxin family protein [Candidatus Bandiella woodruffii]WPX96105.1 Thiol-disulfide oxidoreductase family protein [Candidatus Bandiella woodruffii]